MQEFPHGFPFVQFFGLGASFAESGAAVFELSLLQVFGSDGTGSILAGVAGAAGAAEFVVTLEVESLWQTSACAMQLFPHGLPFLQLRASALAIKETQKRLTRQNVATTDFKFEITESPLKSQALGKWQLAS